MTARGGDLGLILRVATHLAALSATFVGYGMIQPLLSLHTSRFVGSSYLLVGVLISTIGLVKAGLGPVSGFLSDVHGRKRLAAVGAATIATSLAVVYLSNSVTVLITGYVLYGAGQAMFFLAMMTSMIDAAGPERRALAMGLYEGGNGLAIMVGSAASSLLVGVIGVAAVIGVASIFSAAAFMICILLIKETHPTNSARGPILDLAGIRSLIGLEYATAMYTAFLFMYSQSVFSSIIPLYTTQTGLLRIEELALLFVAFAGATALGSLLAGPISDRVGRRIPIAAGMILAALSFAGLFTSGYPLVLTGSSLALGFGTGFFHPVASALVADVSGLEDRGKAFGFYRLTRDLGTFVGPAVAGVTSALLGVSSIFLLSAGLAVLGCLLAIFTVGKKNRCGLNEADLYQ